MIPSAVSDAVAKTRQLEARREVEQHRLVSLLRSQTGGGRTRLRRSIAALIGVAAGLVGRLFQLRRAVETEGSQ
jgi:hypothetical protein